MKSRATLAVVAAVVLGLQAVAQVGSRTGGPPPAQPSTTTLVTAPSPAPLDNISPILAQIQSTAHSTTNDLNQLNIRKWKVGNDTKNDAETKAGAIRRNLNAALPEILGKVQASPNDFGASFKLYRNLGVLYDVMSSLAESAGAFGSKPEFDSMAADLNRIDQARRALGDHLDLLASAKDAEIVRLQNQLKAERAVANTPPKKIVVDEEEKPKPAKKVTPKKKPANPPDQQNKQQ